MSTRVVLYGQQPTAAPAGTFRPIHFPQLAPLDEGTKEGYISRKLSSEGGRARDGMPLTISMQYIDDMGHLRSVPVGALHEIFFDGENGNVSGKGWLADTDDGHLAEILVLSKALAKNSVDLGEIDLSKVQIIEHGDYWDDDFWMEVIFGDYAIAKTTLVATPAFAMARGELPDEIQAALGSDEPLVVDIAPSISGHTQTEEIMAGAEALPSWDHFHRAEADIPHKIIVGTRDEDGFIPVYGHLAIWNQPHRGYDGRTVYAPRPRNAYREFNQPSVLTNRGQVEAGPIALYGGHVSLRDAVNDPRNAWCDVKVTAGKHGPWVCGVVRPHVSAEDADVYVARASRISGHWKGDDLCMIVSCNSEGFNIPGRGWDAVEPDELVAALTPEDEDWIVASFDPDAGPALIAIPEELLSMDTLTEEGQKRTLEWAQRLSGNSTGFSTTTVSLSCHNEECSETGQWYEFPDGGKIYACGEHAPDITADPEFDAEQAARTRELELFLESEVDA